jgi:hypothetical protein
MSNAADLGTSSSAGGNFVSGGLANTISSLDTNAFHGSAFQIDAGTANNQASAVAALGAADLFEGYSGYAISFTGQPITLPVPTATNNTLTTLMDNLPILTWPKDQQIYYKLVGYNTNTQTFETWVIAEEIVPRTETFDPSGNFPNFDYGIFFTPPSGNQLSNIKIVGRWIQ